MFPFFCPKIYYILFFDELIIDLLFIQKQSFVCNHENIILLLILLWVRFGFILLILSLLIICILKYFAHLLKLALNKHELYL